MGFFQGIGDAFGFGDGGAGDAANQIQAANFAAGQTQSRAFRQSEGNLLDILEGQRTGPVDARTDAERLLELTESQGNNPQFAARLKQFISAGGTGFDSGGRTIPGFEDDDNFFLQLQSGTGQLGERTGTRDPSGQGGLAGFQQDVTQASRLGGFDQRLNEIFQSPNFQALRDERERSVRGQLAAGGLTRSGTALREIANVPTQLGFDIENQQFGRQSGLFTQGLNQRLNIENLRQAQAGVQAGLQQSTGQAESQGILAGRQAQAAGIGNLASLVGGIATGGLSTIAQGATGFTGGLGRFGRSFQQ